MNPNFLTDGAADFGFDAFDEAHTNPAEFIGGPDRGGNVQRGLLYLAPAKVWSRVDAFECVHHFSRFHLLLSWLRRRFIQRHHYFIRRTLDDLRIEWSKPCKH